MDTAQVLAFSEELLKIGKARYEKEIERGAIRRAELGTGAGKYELPGILGAAQRKTTRGALAAPAEVAPEALARKRQLAEKLYRTQRTAIPGVLAEHVPGMGPGMAAEKVYAPPSAGRFLRSATKGRVGRQRALASTFKEEQLPEGMLGRLARRVRDLGPAAPEDPTLTHAVLRHELGERAGMEAPKVHPFASHIGPRAILEEQAALKGDPKATRAMGKVREMHPDDATSIGLNGTRRVRVASRRGEIELGVRITPYIRPGVVFIPFHFAEAAANALTNSALDPIAKIPELKVCAVKVEAVT